MTYPGTVKNVLLAKETTWGTEVSPTKDVGLLLKDVSYNWEREVTESLGIGAIDTQAVNGGIFDPKITLNGEFQHGRLLEFIFGTVSHSSTGSDTKHTFTVSDTPPSASFEIGNNLSAGDTEATMTGMLVESAELSIELNGILMLSVTFAGKTVATSTTAAAAVLSTLQNFPHALCTVKLNDVAATECQEAKITITKVVERSGGISSNLFQQGHAVELKLSYSATLGFSDATYHNLWLGGSSPSTTSNPTAFNFEIIADNGTALGSGKRDVSIKLDSTIGKTFNEVTSIGGLTFVEIEGSGKFNSAYSTDNIASGSW